MKLRAENLTFQAVPHGTLLQKKIVLLSMAEDKLYLNSILIIASSTHMMHVYLKDNFTNQ